MLCSEALLVNADPHEGHASVLKCKRWHCELCRPLNHRRIKRAAREGRPNIFLTLTVNPARYETPDAAARDLKNAWVNLRRRMRRAFDLPEIPFIAIFESTKAGWPHLHILMRSRFIPHAWYKHAMADLIGAPMVWVKYVPDVGRVAAYVAKYVSKAPEAFAHCKRWWRSHDYQVDKEECQPFRRYGPYISEIKGKIEEHLWRTYGGRSQIVEQRSGYWRWKVNPLDGAVEEGGRYRLARH